MTPGRIVVFPSDLVRCLSMRQARLVGMSVQSGPSPGACAIRTASSGQVLGPAYQSQSAPCNRIPQQRSSSPRIRRASFADRWHTSIQDLSPVELESRCSDARVAA